MSISRQILQAANIEEVALEYVDGAKRKGKDIYGICPSCGGRKFSVSPTKDMFKCFTCGIGGANSINLIMEVKNMTFGEACTVLAERYSIKPEGNYLPQLEDASAERLTFRDAQLRGSGIPLETTVYKGMERYSSGTIDKKWKPCRGDDMILRYLDLDGQPMQYYRTTGSVAQDFFRIRWAFPEQHCNKDGDPIKYQSPPGSESKLWLPNEIIERYNQHRSIDTLYITEGEKKADKMCLHSLMAVGISGIHNLSGSQTPDQLREIIVRCQVTRVVLVLDADFRNISKKDLERKNPPSNRPASFKSAAIKFKDYISNLQAGGLDVEIGLIAGKSMSQKGIDDLLVTTTTVDGAFQSLIDDIHNLFVTGHHSEHFNVWNLSVMTHHKISEIWGLQSLEAFCKIYKAELEAVEKFKWKGMFYRIGDSGDPELAQPVTQDEMFWRTKEVDTQYGPKTTCTFLYAQMREFLRNRGFGTFYVRDDVMFIQQLENIINRVQGHDIRKYVIEFMDTVDDADAKEMMLRSGNRYISNEKLENMHDQKPDFMQPISDAQFLYFRDHTWKVSKNAIQKLPYSHLPASIWGDRIIDFSPNVTEPIFTIEPDPETKKLQIVRGKLWNDCEYARYIEHTCLFYWREAEELSNAMSEFKPEWLDTMNSHVLAKVLASGYVLHEHVQQSNLRAVVCMDWRESPVGRADGGTGKSIFARSFENMCPIWRIDGMKRNLEDDPYIFAGVDDHTQMILFDDCRPNLDFSFFFSKITAGIQVRRMRENPFNITPRKMMFTTNHAIRGDGKSFTRRQYLLGFSDYYNEQRTPAKTFGHDLFDDWNHDQWELYYNFNACALQAYLRYGLNHYADQDNLETRKVRQYLGENFIEWADLFWDEDGSNINKSREKMDLLRQYWDACPSEKRYTDARTFKEKVIRYCQYSGLDFNPNKNGDRYKSGSSEYFVVANDKFNIAYMHDDSQPTMFENYDK